MIALDDALKSDAITRPPDRFRRSQRSAVSACSRDTARSSAPRHARAETESAPVLPGDVTELVLSLLSRRSGGFISPLRRGCLSGSKERVQVLELLPLFGTFRSFWIVSYQIS